MVRLVFRPYTQVWRLICTSESLRASKRVSFGFTLLKHSSPSFGTLQVCSYSNVSGSRIGRSMMCSSLRGGLISAFTFIVPAGFCHPKTRTHVRLLGLCFKKGCIESYNWQQPCHSVCTLSLNSIPQFKDIACCPSWSKTNWEERGQPKRACPATPVLDLILHTTSNTTSQNQLPYCGAYQSVWSEDMHRRSIWIPKTHITKQNCLNLSNALLIPCASLSIVSCTINFVFKVLFIFPSRYLFASGLVPIFSFRSLSPILGCIPKQPDS